MTATRGSSIKAMSMLRTLSVWLFESLASTAGIGEREHVRGGKRQDGGDKRRRVVGEMVQVDRTVLHGEK